MPTKRLKARLLVMGVVIGLAAGCTRGLKEERYTRAAARIELLIAGDASEYKDQLRQRLIDHYSLFSNIDVVNIGKLREVNMADYHVVVIMDTCLAWSRFNPSTKAFLDRVSDRDRDRVVILMTADDTDWEFQYQGVDAMTSASNPENEDQVFERLRTKIDRIIGEATESRFRQFNKALEADLWGRSRLCDRRICQTWKEDIVCV